MRAKIQFVRSMFDCPIVRFSLGNGSVWHALVDTGSEITLVDENFAKDNKGCFNISFTGDKVVMYGVSGSNEKPVVNAKAKVMIDTKDGNMDCDLDAILCNLDHIKAKDRHGDEFRVTAVLGCDFLKEYKAKINFINSQLSLEQ